MKARTYRAADGRFLGLFVPASFDDFQPAWEGRRARLTEGWLPLQVVLVERPASSQVAPHYHPVIRQVQVQTRHQVLLCVRGRVRVGLYTVEGEHVDTVELGPGDLVLAAEGHSVEVLEPGSRWLEIQTGPVDDSDPQERVELVSAEEARG